MEVALCYTLLYTYCLTLFTRFILFKLLYTAAQTVAGLPRQHCRLTICIELVELTNSIR